VHKDNQPKSSGLLVPIKSAYPFQILCVDFKGPIKISKNGYKYILVCVDHFTSWVEAAPLKSITAKEVIEVFFKMFISRHGCPEMILTDQGKQFVSEAFKDLCTQFGIRKEQTTAYHQQCNGKVEKFNKFLSYTIATQLKPDQSNWDELIDPVLFTYRVTLNRMLEDSPFFLIYGRDAQLPQDNKLPVSNDDKRLNKDDMIDGYKAKQLETLRAAYEKLNLHKEKEQRVYKAHYDKTHKDVKFNVHDHVMLYTERTQVGLSKKFLPRWDGPYLIIQAVGPVNYRIESLDKKKTHLVHVNRLKIYKPW